MNMGTLMKTTVELSDALFRAAKEHAQQSQMTLRALIEEGLRRVIGDGPGKPRPAFKLKDARVHGKAMLISDPKLWQQLEEVHVANRVLGAPARSRHDRR